MGIDKWLLWMILAAILVVGEVFTAGFFLLWFGVGAAVAGVLALVGLGAAWQWGSFVVVSGVLFAVSRRFADRFSRAQPPGIGADRFIGRTGIVLEDVNNVSNTGRIRVDKEEWRAESATGLPILAGTRVKVERLDGAHMVVRTLDAEEGE
jgi:membrane protein implicated in regulation of membrane protease activity